MSVPTKTIDHIGVDKTASLLRFKSHEDYRVDGIDLNDLSVLAHRLNSAITDPNELRDWQNRINLLVSEATHLSGD